MGFDPLKQFRQSTGSVRPAAPLAGEAEGESDAYEAFSVVDRTRNRLAIRTAGASWVYPAYHHLVDVTEDAGAGRNFTLNYDHMTVVVKGRNLHQVVKAIVTDQCEFIQEFDHRLWKRPANPETPVIETIRMEHVRNSEHPRKGGLAHHDAGSD